MSIACDCFLLCRTTSASVDLLHKVPTIDVDSLVFYASTHRNHRWYIDVYSLWFKFVIDMPKKIWSAIEILCVGDMINYEAVITFEMINQAKSSTENEKYFSNDI